MKKLSLKEIYIALTAVYCPKYHLVYKGGIIDVYRNGAHVGYVNSDGIFVNTAKCSVTSFEERLASVHLYGRII